MPNTTPLNWIFFNMGMGARIAMMNKIGGLLLLAGLLLAAACSDMPLPIEGEEGGVCYANSTCNAGLVCQKQICVRPTIRGYALFGLGNTTYLVDTTSKVVHTWSHNSGGASMPYLMKDGTLLRPGKASVGSLSGGGAGGLIQRIDWDGKVLRSWVYSNDTVRQHHDIEPMPNGNVLLIAWEKKTRQQAEAAGRVDAPNGIWPLQIVEVKPQGTSGGTIVWKWHAWDHLVQDKDPKKANYGKVSEHPELFDVNFGYVKTGAPPQWAVAPGARVPAGPRRASGRRYPAGVAGGMIVSGSVLLARRPG